MAVTFDAVGAGTSGAAATSLSETHVLGASATAITCYLTTDFVGISPTRPSITATCGGVAMAEKATILYYNNVGGTTEYIWITAFALLNPGTGSKAVAATIGGSGAYSAMNSFSYNNVDSFGTAVTNSGTGTTATISATAPTDAMISQGFGGYTAAFSAYNRTSRYNKANVGSVNVGTLVGDAVGTGSALSFTATHGLSAPWGAIAIPLLPPASNSGQFFAMF